MAALEDEEFNVGFEWSMQVGIRLETMRPVLMGANEQDIPPSSFNVTEF